MIAFLIVVTYFREHIVAVMLGSLVCVLVCVIFLMVGCAKDERVVRPIPEPRVVYPSDSGFVK